MPTNRIYLCLAHMSEAGVEQKYIQEAFDTNWVLPLGPNVNGFEKDLEEFCGQNKRVGYLCQDWPATSQWCSYRGSTALLLL